MKPSLKNIALIIFSVTFMLTIFYRVSAQSARAEIPHANEGNIQSVEKNLAATDTTATAAPLRDNNVPSWLLVIFALLAVAFGMLITINLLRKP